MAFTNPTVADFKAYFFRDFPYGSTLDTVTDADITKALAEALFNFNPGLFADQAQYSMGVLYLAAHYLVIDLRASSQGITGSYSWLESSKSVGSVSESFVIPQRILDNPYWAMLSQTPYGAKFLSLILPRLLGNIMVLPGRTQP